MKTVFARPLHHLDFADTRAMAPPETAFALSGFPARGGTLDALDAADALAQADAADRSLLTLVACAAVATLVLALACSV